MIKRGIRVKALLIISICLFTLMGLSVVASQREGTTYYVDSDSGNDSNSGVAVSHPWKSLEKVNQTTFFPGDKILFKAGGSWIGQLHPLGSGNASNQITIDKYGEGNKPQILANGQHVSAVLLDGQEYWTIRNLEVTNDDPTVSPDPYGIRHGIYIRAKTSGITSNIFIEDCEVHHIEGENRRNVQPSMYFNAAIYISVPGRSSATKHFDNVQVTNSYVHDVRTAGIKINQESDYIVDQYNTNFKISNCVVRNTGSDGIIMQCCVNPICEYTQVLDAGGRSTRHETVAGQSGSTGVIAGLWICGVQDCLIQYNEVARTRKINPGPHGGDGTAFDPDWGVGGKLIHQYNYTHENEGGFILNCASFNYDNDYEKTICRYNVSVNDWQEIIQKDSNQLYEFYNNVFYNDMDTPWTRIASDGGNGLYRFWNNIFYVKQEPDWGTNTFSNNCYYNPSQSMSGPSSDANAILADPQFINPGVLGDGMAYAANYKIKAGSPCIDQGMAIADNGGKDFWGNTVSGRPDIGAHDATPGPVIVPEKDYSYAFSDDFSDQNATEWTTHGGQWNVANQSYTVASSNTGVKAVVDNTNYTDFTYEADVKVQGNNQANAGLIFRANDVVNGLDKYRGYYVGISSSNTLILGKANYSWAELGSVTTTIQENVAYRLKVVVKGSLIKVYLNGELKLERADSAFTSGKIGVRSFKAGVTFDNIKATATFKDNFDDGNSQGWHEYDGSWTVSNQKFKVASSNSGAKTAVDSTQYDNFIYEGKVTLKSTGNRDAGLIFRGREISSGLDHYRGYYVGISAGQKLVLGKSNYSWSEISNVPLTVNANATYTLRIVANETSIKVYVDDVLKIEATDHTFSTGQIGLRSYKAEAEYDDIMVEALN